MPESLACVLLPAVVLFRKPVLQNPSSAQCQWFYGCNNIFYHADIGKLLPGTKLNRNMPYNNFCFIFKNNYLYAPKEYYAAIERNVPWSLQKTWRKLKWMMLNRRQLLKDYILYDCNNKVFWKGKSEDIKKVSFCQWFQESEPQ